MKFKRNRAKGFGKPDFTVSIIKSNRTSNLLIMVESVIVDSTIHRHEAKEIKAWWERELDLRPFRDRLCGEALNDWANRSPRLKEYPTSTAEILVWNQETMRLESSLATISGDNIVEAMQTSKGTWVHPNTVVCKPGGNK